MTKMTDTKIDCSLNDRTARMWQVLKNAPLRINWDGSETTPTLEAVTVGEEDIHLFPKGKEILCIGLGGCSGWNYQRSTSAYVAYKISEPDYKEVLVWYKPR